MKKVSMKPISDEEREKIHVDVEKNFKVPRLLPDPGHLHLASQNFALVSVISPWSECANSEMQEVDEFLKKRRFSKVARMQLLKLMYDKMKIMIKIRGVFGSEENAEAWANDRIGPAEGMETHVAPLYEYGFWPPDKYADKDRKKNYADKQAQEFYEKQRKKTEEDRRIFQRRMEVFREECKENNESYQSLTDEERDALQKNKDEKIDMIAGVPVEKVLQHESFKKIMTNDTFREIQKISGYLGIGHDQLYEAWAQLRHAEKLEAQKEKSDVGGSGNDIKMTTTIT